MSKLNEWLWQTLGNNNMFGQEIDSNFNLRNKITEKNCIPPDFHLPTWENSAAPYTPPGLLQNLLCNRSVMDTSPLVPSDHSHWLSPNDFKIVNMNQ